MTYTDLGTSKSTSRGSRTRRRGPANLSDLLMSLRKDYPKDTKAEIRERFCNAVSELVGATGNQALLAEASGFWFDLHYPKLCEPVVTPPRPSPVEREAEIQRQTEAIVQADRKALLRNIEWNGKNILDLTREECAAGKGLFSVFVEKLKPGQKVGAVFTLKQVHAALRKQSEAAGL